jgi:integrase
MRSSAGSIERLKDGRYKITVTIGYNPRTGKQRRKSKTIRGSKRDAERVKAQLLTTEDFGTEYTLGSYVEIYLDAKRESVRADTFNGYEKDAQKILKSDIAFLKLKDVEKNEKKIREWLNAESTFGGRRNAYKILRQVLHHAKRNHLITACVTDFIDPPKTEVKEKETITTETLPAYLKAVKGSYIEAGVLLMLGCGLRRSEALGLKWCEIEWERGDDYFGRFEVKRGCYTKAGGGVYFDAPKTLKSKREILMPVWVGERMFEIKRNGYICEYEGKIIQPQSFTQKWVKTLKENDLPLIQVRNLRHSCGTMLIREADASVTDVQQLLGHTSYHTTETFYIQKSDKASRRIASAMNKFNPKF